MRINTRDGSVELTKQEQASLDKAYRVLAGLAKHGSDDLEKAAEESRDSLERVIQVLKGVPAVEAPY